MARLYRVQEITWTVSRNAFKTTQEFGYRLRAMGSRFWADGKKKRFEFSALLLPVFSLYVSGWAALRLKFAWKFDAVSVQITSEP